MDRSGKSKFFQQLASIFLDFPISFKDQTEYIISNLRKFISSIFHSKETGWSEQIKEDLTNLELNGREEESLDLIQKILKQNEMKLEIENMYLKVNSIRRIDFFTPYQIEYFLNRIKEKKFLDSDLFFMYKSSRGPDTLKINDIDKKTLVVFDYTSPKYRANISKFMLNIKMRYFLINLSIFFKKTLEEEEDELNALERSFFYMSNNFHDSQDNANIVVVFTNFLEFEENLKRYPSILDHLSKYSDDLKGKSAKEIIEMVYHSMMKINNLQGDPRFLDFHILDLIFPHQVFECFQKTLPHFQIEEPPNLKILTSKFISSFPLSVQNYYYYPDHFKSQTLSFMFCLKILERKGIIARIPKFVVFEILKKINQV